MSGISFALAVTVRIPMMVMGDSEFIVMTYSGA
jgi:hypothetical protein